MQLTNKKGQYIRIRKPFSLENFNDGYIDRSTGRFRVYSPRHLRANKEGYVYRAIVAYELYHNIKVPRSKAIHHIDGNRLNDSKENLKMLTHHEHAILHNLDTDAHIEKICRNCGNKFVIERWRLKDPSRGRFCSQKCYQEKERSIDHKKHISDGLKKAYSEGRR